MLWQSAPSLWLSKTPDPQYFQTRVIIPSVSGPETTWHGLLVPAPGLLIWAKENQTLGPHGWCQRDKACLLFPTCSFFLDITEKKGLDSLIYFLSIIIQYQIRSPRPSVSPHSAPLKPKASLRWCQALHLSLKPWGWMWEVSLLWTLKQARSPSSTLYSQRPWRPNSRTIYTCVWMKRSPARKPGVLEQHSSKTEEAASALHKTWGQRPRGHSAPFPWSICRPMASRSRVRDDAPFYLATNSWPPSFTQASLRLSVLGFKMGMMGPCILAGLLPVPIVR